MYLSNNSNSFLSVEELERNRSGYTLEEIKRIIDNSRVDYNPLVRICADCLMPNHFHFLIQEIQKDGITKFMQKFGTSYAKYFAIKHDRPGSLFQGRFRAVHIKTDDQLRYILAYINAINPAQLIEPNLKESGIKNATRLWKFIDKYNWSTHQEFMDRRKSIIINKGLLGKLYPSQKFYSNFIKSVLHGKEKKIGATLSGLTID